MKTAMKLTTGILAMAVMAGAAWAQNTDAIDQARSIAKSLQQKQANDTNAALDAAGVKAKPAPGAPAPAVKPAVIPGSKTAPTTAAAKPTTAQSAAAKNSAAPAKSQTVAGKPADAAKKVAVVKGAPKVAAVKPAAPANAANSPKAATATAVAATPTVNAAAADASKIGDTAKPKAEDKKWAMNGKRDPFFSPVVQQQGGSGCATGKKCLEIGNINLRGVVKSDSGFIAVVTNNLNKAYFLRENDPVFNGYVVRITGDSVVFQETVQDKLGKPFTREVVKRIFTPAV